MHAFSIAPMLDWTDRHYRYFARLLTRHALLYTEMITTGAILHGDAKRHLIFDNVEHPIAAQLGGSDPKDLLACAKIVEDYGYDEVNLNVGCPSDRVQSGRFGACLMKEPALVADCVSAMSTGVNIPVTVKTRIGVDDHDSYQQLHHFIETVSAAGCQHFIIHARKAWLKGLSPKENRTVPPLDYPTVYQLKADFPALSFVLNGGLDNVTQAKQHLTMLDGVMLGRAAYHDPYQLAIVDLLYFGDQQEVPTREAVLDAFIPYLEKQLHQGRRLSSIIRHILGLYKGVSGGKQWRRMLSEGSRDQSAVDFLSSIKKDTRAIPMA